MKRLALILIFMFLSEPLIAKISVSKTKEEWRAETIIYKGHVFCNLKVVVNWKKDLSQFCNVDDIKKLSVFVERKTSAPFIFEFMDFYEKYQSISVRSIDDKKIIRVLSYCLKKPNCRLQRKAKSTSKNNKE